MSCHISNTHIIYIYIYCIYILICTYPWKLPWGLSTWHDPQIMAVYGSYPMSRNGRRLDVVHNYWSGFSNPILLHRVSFRGIRMKTHRSQLTFISWTRLTHETATSQHLETAWHGFRWRWMIIPDVHVCIHVHVYSYIYIICSKHYIYHIISYHIIYSIDWIYNILQYSSMSII